MYFYRVINIILNSNAEVSDFNSSGQISINSNLVLGGSVTLANLTSLQSINGQLIVQNSLVQQVSIPSLVSTNGILITDNNSLTTINLPSLQTVNGDVVIQNNPVLTTIDLGAI
jgi:hypothetical protein